MQRPVALDTPEALADALLSALAVSDAVVLTGGSSVGVRDLTPRVIDELGKPGVVVHGLRVKPGKPTVFAMLDGKPVIGLPGNPASSLMILEAVAAPIFSRLAGESTTPDGSIAAVVERPFAGRDGWTWFVPAEIRYDRGRVFRIAVRPYGRPTRACWRAPTATSKSARRTRTSTPAKSSPSAASAVGGAARTEPKADMSVHPQPAPAIRAVPATTPFVAPEELARRVGRTTLVRLGANESAFGASPKALAAMRAALPLISNYGDPESVDLRTALAARHGCAIENIVVGSGVDELLGLICRTYGALGDPVLMSHGSYATFAFQVRGHGLDLHTVPPFPDGRVDIEAMLARARDLKPKIVYLANPDNPSGTFIDAGAVVRLRDGLPPDTLFVLDEAYADFVTEGTRLPNGIDERTIRLYTFSKMYGMAGARVGYALASREAIATFQKIRNHFGVNRTAQIGALAALEDDAFAKHIVAEVVRGARCVSSVRGADRRAHAAVANQLRLL